MGATLSNLTVDSANGRPDLGDIPESCVACVFVHLTPPKICNLARLNHAFRGTATSDSVWKSKLPPNYHQLLELLPPERLQNLSKEDVFALLSWPVPFDDGNKEVWLDRVTGRICMSISAKGMAITGIEDRRYWNWLPTEESSLALSQGWSLRQLDINNAFLQGHLSEDVYLAQPPGFISTVHPDYVCKLDKAIYGLKQAPRAWYEELKGFLLTSNFRNATADSSLFIYTAGSIIIYLLVYVDDIIITWNDDKALDTFISLLGRRFALKDLGSLSYFLGIEIIQNDHGCILSQQRYATELLARFHMDRANPVTTPLPPDLSGLTAQSGSPLDDVSEYRIP